MSAASSANFNYGFPTPGPQNPTGQDVMNHVFFVSSTEWKQLREEQQFDYIIIGYGFCGYAFAQRVLEKHPVQNPDSGARPIFPSRTLSEPAAALSANAGWLERDLSVDSFARNP